MSQASASKASQRSSDQLRGMLVDLPGGGGNELSQELNGVDEIRTRGGEMSPQEVHKALWQVSTPEYLCTLRFDSNFSAYLQVLTFRDSKLFPRKEIIYRRSSITRFKSSADVVKVIEKTIERIPGLSSMVEKLTDAINRFVFTTLEPMLKP